MDFQALEHLKPFVVPAISALFTLGVGYFLLRKTRSNAHLDRALNDIEKALSEYSDWSLEMVNALKEKKASSSIQELIADKRSVVWIEKLRENKEQIEQVQNVANILYHRQEKLNERIKNYFSVPHLISGDSFKVGSFMLELRIDIVFALSRQDELLKQLKLHVRRLIHKDTSGIKSIHISSAAENLHVDPVGTVFIGHYESGPLFNSIPILLFRFASRFVWPMYIVGVVFLLYSILGS